MVIERTHHNRPSPIVQSQQTQPDARPSTVRPREQMQLDRSSFDPAVSPTPTKVNALAVITSDPITFLRDGSGGPQVEELQKKLKDAGFDPGPIDGQYGDQTRAAVTAFQQARGLSPDGIVGPQTRDALLQPAPAADSNTPAPGGDAAVTDPAVTAPTGDGRTPAELEAQALQQHGPEFVQRVGEIAERLGVKPEWLLAVMKNESEMAPGAVNPDSGATGLIQFMPDTAEGLGTTTAELGQMSALEQLEYVEKFYAPNAGKYSSGEDLYLGTFYPAATGKSDDYNIGGALVAEQNPIFDLNGNGQITAGEFREYYRNRFPALVG